MSTRGLPQRREQGAILLVTLVALTLAAAAAVDHGQRRADERRRQAEAELLFIGEQYRQAIESYWRQSPGAARAMPTRLSELLQDPRVPFVRRHLRKAFSDPLLPGEEWGLVKQGNAIVGVYSLAPGTPFRRIGFSEAQRGFDDAASYAQWRFMARVPSDMRPRPLMPASAAQTGRSAASG